jgi:hypothetical protein
MTNQIKLRATTPYNWSASRTARDQARPRSRRTCNLPHRLGSAFIIHSFS